MGEVHIDLTLKQINRKSLMIWASLKIQVSLEIPVDFYSNIR